MNQMLNKNTKRQYQGVVNKASGDSFELLIDRSLDYYLETGFAYIEKTPEPLRPIKNMGDGRFLAFYEKQAQPDYKGVIKGGRMVVFEAKHTTTGRVEQSRVKEHQLDALVRYANFSALSFVLIGFDMTHFYRIPTTMWVNMKGAFGRMHVKPGDLEDIWKITIGRKGQLLIFGE